MSGSSARSTANRAYLTRGGGHYIHAEKLRRTNARNPVCTHVYGGDNGRVVLVESFSPRRLTFFIVHTGSGR